MVVINATDGVPLTPRGKTLQRPGQAVGGHHLVPPGPHLHRADDDLQPHALVDLEDNESLHPPAPQAHRVGSDPGRSVFSVQEPVSC